MQFIQTESDQIEFCRSVQVLENLAKKKLKFWLDESRNPTSKARFQAATFAKNEADEIVCAVRVIRNLPQIFTARYVAEITRLYDENIRLQGELTTSQNDLEIIKILAQKGSFDLIRKHLL
jgi:hypothetical protein